MTLEQDADNRMVSLGVQDSDVKQQKEMWGMYIQPLSDDHG